MIAVDALRGVAALAVVLFHYTTRFVELYGANSVPTLVFPAGHYGVNLFFIISGFVIFMTLERTKHPFDFVVSRFSRLFPAFWVAIALTWTVTQAFGLPGKEVNLSHALLNVFMLHGLLGVPHVDGVYWTLEVELLFYIGMLTLYLWGRLHRVHWVIWALLFLRMAYYVAANQFGVDLSWTLSRLLILKYVPWFALGICVYQSFEPAAGHPQSMRWTMLAALTCLLLVDGWQLAALATLMSVVVWAAARGSLPLLEQPVLVFFGTISYTLYLLHENIGWVVQRTVLSQGASFDLSIVLALVVCVALASALTQWVERPAMGAIRKAYRRLATKPRA